MKRDFSMEAYEEIVGYLEEVEPDNYIGHCIDVVVDVWYYIKHLFTKPTGDATEEKLKRYRREVVDKRNLWIEEINNVFIAANEADEEYAAKGALLYEEGTQLLRKLKTVTDMAALDKLSGVATLGETGGSFDTDATKEMSDEELKEYLNSSESSTHQYTVALTNVSSSVLDMNFWTAAWICFFQGKDVLLDDLLNTPAGKEVYEKVKQNIIEGKDGYDSVEDIAEQLGITPEQVRIMLRANTPRRQGGRTNLGVQGQYWKKYDALQEIVEENLRRVFQNEALSTELASELGMSVELAQAMTSGEVNGYSVSLYREAILSSLEKTTGEKTFEFDWNDLAKTQDILKGYKTWYTLKYTTAKGSEEELNEMLQNNILSEDEAEAFLKEYCGFEVVKEADIVRLKSMTKVMDAVGDIGKFMKYTEDGINELAYLFEDYTAELEMLDTLIATSSGSPEYQLALQQVREEYTDKFGTVVQDILEMAAEEGLDAALDKVPGYGVTDLVISGVGVVTGADGYLDAAQDVLAYSTVSSEAVSSYDRAIEYAKEQNFSDASLENVRNSFAIMKNTMLAYYDAQIEYADGMHFGALEDKQYKAYLEYEKRKLEDLQLGEPYTAMSYDDYLSKYGKGGTGLSEEDF